MPLSNPRLQAFLAAAGIAPDAAVKVTAFGDSADMQDELAALVAAGVKRATTSLLRWYREGGEEMPKVGDLFVVVDGADRPRCICRTVQVDVERFADVDADFAAAEGEGDGTLDYWRTAHRAFFGREAATNGFTFTEDMEVVLDRFELVFVPSAGS